MTKKKRSAKQRANDRRLGRMAKARAKKRRANPGHKKKRKSNDSFIVAGWSPSAKKSCLRRRRKLDEQTSQRGPVFEQ